MGYVHKDMDVVSTFEGWLWLDLLVFPLGVLWLNGIVDCPLMGFLTLGFVTEAPRGRSLGHMTPCLFSTPATVSSSESLASPFRSPYAPIMVPF